MSVTQHLRGHNNTLRQTSEVAFMRLEGLEMTYTRELLRPSDLAPLMGVGRGRIYQLVAAGVLPSIRRGRSILIPRAAWERWLVDQRDQALAAAKLTPQESTSG